MSGKNWLPSMQHNTDGDKGCLGTEKGNSRHLTNTRNADAAALSDQVLTSAVKAIGRACALAAALALSAPFGAGTAAAQDATLPTVSVSDAQAYEDSGYLTFVISLSQPSSEEVTVDFSTAGVTATKGTDFSGGSHTITFPPNREAPQRIGVRLYDDHENEPDETFTFTLANPVGATLGNATATGTIRNDDTGATLTASDIEDTTATLTVAGHTDGWWYKGGDLAGRNAHQCTAVAAGTTAVSISGLTAAKLQYYRAYSDSTCDTRLAKVWFWTLAPESVTPTVSVSDAEVSEDGSLMRFWVSLSEPSREEVTVRYHTSGGTATSRVDFSAKSGTLTFAPNRIGRQWVGVIVYDDQDPEPDETFTLTLTNPTGATLGNATATGTIKDDGDTGATLTASDIEDTTATLSISGHTDSWWYRGRESGTSQQWGTCTAVAAGTTSVGISGLTTVTNYEYLAYSDSACGTKLAKVKFGTLAPAATPTVSVSDAEVSEDGRYIHFKVSLSHPSRENVTVRYALRSGTATIGSDFESPGWQVLHFFANSSNTVRSERITVLDDQEPEPDETFTLTLTKAWGATLGDATATGTILDDGDTDARLAVSDIEDTTATLSISGHTGGWWYRGEDKRTNELGACTAVAAGTTSVSIGGLTTITNYDYTAYSDSACGTKLARVTFRTIAPAGTPAVSVSDGQVSEDGGSVRFWVSLSHPSRERVTVDYHTTGGTATSGTDFSAESRTLGFSPNSGDSYALHVGVIDDQDPEPDETFTVTLSNPVGATLGDATATGTILDDGDTGATLGAGDIEDTTATLTVTDHTGGWWYKGGAHSCTAVAAGTTAVSIGGLTAVTDYEYTAYSDSTCQTKLANVEFRTLAPEGVTPTVSVSDAEVAEDGTWMQFWVSLSEPTREEVTVDVRTSDGTAAGGSDFEAASRTLTFAPNSTEAELMPVLVHDDRLPEPDETFTVTLTNPKNATLGDATATGTIKDDGDTGATLTASDIEDTTATLTIGGHAGRWWYKGGWSVGSVQGSVHSCTAVAAGAKAVSVGGLTAAVRNYYYAYSDSTCDTRLAKVEFRTLAPAGTPRVSVSGARASEDGAPMIFKVSLSHPSREQVTVGVHTSGGTATSGTDFRAESETLTFPANRRGHQYLDVTVIDDQETEPDETFTVTLTNPVGATLGVATATGTIMDDDGTGVTLSASDIEDTTATLTVAGHSGGWWYKGNAHSCTAVAAGTTAASIGGLTAVTAYEYFAYSDSACRTMLANVKFISLAPSGTPTVSVSDAEVSEDGTWMEFKVSLSHPSREPVTVDYHTTGGTATSGTDFRAESRTLTFRPNREARRVSVLVHDDQEPEPDETLTLTLTNPTGATLGHATATGTIKDDGDTGTTLSASDIEDTTATLAIGSHAGDWWYRGNAHSCTAVAAGTSSVSISGLTAVTTYGYAAYSDSACQTKLASVEFRTLAPEGVTPTVSVSDAQVSENGTWMRFWVSLSEPTREEVTVDVRTSDGTATSGTDFKAMSLTLTFPPNSSDPELAPVIVRDDQEPEPDETFTVALTNPSGATLGDAAATGTILDDGDTPATFPVSDNEDTTPPRLVYAYAQPSGVLTWKLLLSYNEALDSDSVPAAGDFSVKVDGNPRAVEEVRVQSTRNTKYVILDMSGSAYQDQVVTFSYAAGAKPIQDSVGNDAPGIVGRAAIVSQELPYRNKRPSGVPVADAGDFAQVDPGASVTLDGSGSSDPDGDSLAFEWVQMPPVGEFRLRPGGPIVPQLGEVVLTGADTAQPTFVAPVEPGLLTFYLTVSDPSGRADGDEVRVRVRDLVPDFGDATVEAITLTTGAAMEPLVLPEATGGNGELTYALTSEPAGLAGLSFDHARRTISGSPKTNGTWTFTYTAADADNVSGDGDEASLTFTIKNNGDTGAAAVALASDPGDDNTYAAGETVRVAVTFSEAVDVDTEDGTPRLKLDLGGDGAGERWAAYEDGSGTETLTFAWTAEAPDESAAGVAVLADTLEPNGGTIRSKATQADVALGHSGTDADPAHRVDAVAPELLRGEIDGATVTLWFSEALDPDSTGGQFLMGIQTSETASLGCNATGAVSIDGATATIGLGRGCPPAQAGLTARNYVKYLRHAEGHDGSFRDLAGNLLTPDGDAGIGLYVQIDLENVTGKTARVTGAEVVTGAGSDGAYAVGETVEAAVTFDAPVTVETADGAPTLALIANGGIRRAAYASGSGTERLVFAWRVGEADGPVAAPVRVAASGLKLNGGTIASAAGKPAALGFGEAPGVTAVSVGTQEDGRWETGDTVEAALSFAEPVTVAGAPSVGLVLEGAIRRAVYAAGSGTEALTFRYTLVRGDGPWDRAAVAGNSLRLGGGSIVSAGGGLAAALGHGGTGASGEEADPPSVTGVTVVSDAGSDATYGLGERIRVRVAFSEAVAVTGSPGIAIDMDPAEWGEKRAVYERGSGTDALVFVHEVVEPNLSRQGIAVLADTLALHGGATIRSAATQTDAALGHPGRGHDPAHKVDWRLAPAGAEASSSAPSSGPPSVTGVEVVSDAGSDSTYLLGDTIRVRLAFSEAVRVTGTPKLSIDMDPAEWGEKRAAYEGAAGTAALALTFAWTVVEPNWSPRGIAVLADSLALDGGTIVSAATGEAAALGHAGRDHDLAHKVDWRPALSVADARAREGVDEAVVFEVSLDRAFTGASHSVTVDYATADGTATAGEDYTATSGTLTFAAGESSKTVSVALLDDAHDEGEEQFTLRLSNAQGARIADGEATGTIANADPLQQAWLARFGRTVASDAIAAVTARLETPRDAGSHLTLGGHRLSIGGAGDNRSFLPPAPSDGANRPAWSGDHPGAGESRTMSARELLMGTSFRAVLGQGAGSQFTSWGQGASVSRFSGSVPELSLSGETATGSMGMDYERGRFLAGFAMTHSIGEGAAHGADRSYTMGSSVTTVLPFARLAISDRVSAWGLAGSGTGRLTLDLDGDAPERYGTDLAMTLAAAGVRGDLVTPAAAGGFALAFKADAFWVRTESDSVSAPGVGNLAGARAEASRLRAVLDGSRTFPLADGGTLTPSVTLGLRQDGGDAETGSGMELGAGIGYADPWRGLDMALRVHGLAGHADDGYGEWGVSGSVRLAPGDAGRGLSMSLVPSYGADPGGSERLWATPDAYALAADDEAVRSSRLDAELGYGMAVFGGFTGTPNVGVGLSDAARNYRIGWRLTSAGAAGFEVNLDATRRETPDESGSGVPVEHGVQLRGAVRW